MSDKLRVMGERPYNAEPKIQYLRSWITPNEIFFKRNQGQVPPEPIDIQTWRLVIEGNVNRQMEFTYEDIINMPKTTLPCMLECSGNGRSLWKEKIVGNPWIVGGAGNAIWGGVMLGDLLRLAGLASNAHHVAFEGFDKPLGSAGIKFIRSIPIQKAMTSTLLAYEMNGEALPNEHGYPLRAIALGWTGNNCVKWLSKIVVLEKPFEGFYMDKVYRFFDKGKDPLSGEPVTEIPVKSIITKPLRNEILTPGDCLIIGFAYAGENLVQKVEISFDNAKTWQTVDFIGPYQRYAWRQWQYLWRIDKPGTYTILSRATDDTGRSQPMDAIINAHGYCNNGVNEHALKVQVS